MENLEKVLSEKSAERSEALKLWAEELRDRLQNQQKAEILGIDWGREDGEHTTTGIRCSGPLIITLIDGSQHMFKEGTIQLLINNSCDIDVEVPIARKISIVGSCGGVQFNPELLQQLIDAGQTMGAKIQETVREINTICGPIVSNMMEMMEQLQEVYDKEMYFDIIALDDVRFKVCYYWMLGGKMFYGYSSPGGRNNYRASSGHSNSDNNTGDDPEMEELIVIIVFY